MHVYRSRGAGRRGGGGGGGGIFSYSREGGERRLFSRISAVEENSRGTGEEGRLGIPWYR